MTLVLGTDVRDCVFGFESSDALTFNTSVFGNLFKNKIWCCFTPLEDGFRQSFSIIFFLLFFISSVNQLFTLPVKSMDTPVSSLS